jgi:hypothetical protein
MRYIRCVECGKSGHIKCTTEEDSWTIPIHPKVKDNLNEFFKQEKANGKTSS